MELPASGKVYRGLGQMLLPRQFWVAHGSPAWRGGVEKAFMSTTTDKDVAMVYANGRGTVVEISVGRVQTGASCPGSPWCVSARLCGRGDGGARHKRAWVSESDRAPCCATSLVFTYAASHFFFFALVCFFTNRIFDKITSLLSMAT